MTLRLLACGRTGRRTAIPARTVETPRTSSVNLFKRHTTRARRERDDGAHARRGGQTRQEADGEHRERQDQADQAGATKPSRKNGAPFRAFARLVFSLMSAKGTFEDEEVIFHGPANHFQALEGRGGWLILTSSRLSFRSNGMNQQNNSVDLNIGDIADATPVLTWGLLPNGLSVSTNNRYSHSFVVFRRRKWAILIKTQIRGGPRVAAGRG